MSYLRIEKSVFVFCWLKTIPSTKSWQSILLQKAGYLVDAVETGTQALEKVKTNQYNTVLMDVQMPEMDGF